MLAHIHPSRLWFTYETRPIFNDTAYPGSESGAGQGPPGAQSPFARNRYYLLRCGVLHHIRVQFSMLMNEGFFIFFTSCKNESRRSL